MKKLDNYKFSEAITGIEYLKLEGSKIYADT